jgi:tartrate-resistant acid phosphatase type 5
MYTFESGNSFVSFIRRNRQLYTALFFTIILSFTAAWAQSVPSNSVRFLILSDCGGFASNDQKAVAAAMAKEAERVGAQFVVTTGDNYHGDGIATATSPRWKTEFEDVYSYSALQIPWYPSIGNHEYRGNVDCEIEYSTLSTRWKLPTRYYAQKERIDDSSFALIVHLDTSPFVETYKIESAAYHVKGQETKKQLVWLDSVLTVSQTRWTIVVGHHPIYAAAPKHGDTKELIEQVLPILTKHRVPLYVCGHDHVLQHLKNNQMDFIVCGGGAKTRDVNQRDDVVFGIRSLGFLSVTMTTKDIRVNIINDKNSILHSVQIPREISK